MPHVRFGAQYRFYIGSWGSVTWASLDWRCPLHFSLHFAFCHYIPIDLNGRLVDITQIPGIKVRRSQITDSRQILTSPIDILEDVYKVKSSFILSMHWISYHWISSSLTHNVLSYPVYLVIYSHKKQKSPSDLPPAERAVEMCQLL